MTYLPPPLIIALVISAMYGALFHLLWGRTAVGLLRALLIAVVGFLAGEAGARLMGYHTLMVGNVHLGSATVVAWVGLTLDYWRNWRL